jgi:hypothetical protein
MEGGTAQMDRSLRRSTASLNGLEQNSDTELDPKLQEL